VFYGWWWFAATHQKVDVWWKLLLLFLLNPYLLLLLSTSAIDYVMVLFMERSRTQAIRRLWLVISLVSNFGFLGYFKYSGFITDNLNALFAHMGFGFHLPDPTAYPNAMLGTLGVSDDWFFKQVILPIGISFHTFQSMSYTIDAYRRTI